MKTVTIQIGNSDDRLRQVEWAAFVGEVEAAINARGAAVHFFGGAANWAAWQNVAWVVVCDAAQLDALRAAIATIRQRYRQDSAAFTVGETAFV